MRSKRHLQSRVGRTKLKGAPSTQPTLGFDGMLQCSFLESVWVTAWNISVSSSC